MTLYLKKWQILLQTVVAILLQNAAEFYYKICQIIYYKMRQLLKSAVAVIIINCDSAVFL